ncbi:PEP-CTERM sorting domain-containing protein [Chamaesiphon minutus]|uniref:PEP-CTERM putative exosortase interaction domain-containing protein n=1 Tax=Chamaesiphon minutus (strain ATCC 27169 / PCC 6605) TaxID=1173020 RepID=K9ULR7_CHAP6|nr:PEP-CTERM sorting domain-containing protein [Chamaesiphon minutus]AFY95608.1 PEP-CTERM putative exosortase interaction domain-containing protein [Chamaesiphon minutus PCC 6605]
MKLRSVLVSTLGVAALAQFASPVGAVSLINENFDTVSTGFKSASSSVGSFFTVDSGNVEVIGPGFADFYPGNGNYVDLNGIASGTLTSSIFNLNAGSTLSFDFAKNLDGGTFVPIANIFFGGTQIGSVNGGDSFSTFNYVFNTAASGELVISSGNTGPYGVVIDNVNLATAVPEPSEIPGMLLFAGGAFMLRRKYLAKKAK